MYLCLLLSNFSLQSALRWRNPCGPVVVVDANSAKDSILEANTEALAKGVVVGMTPAQAMARAMNILILPRSSAQEQCTNHLLIDIALTLSPDVELTANGVCIADLCNIRTRCWQQLADALLTQLQKYSLHGQIGIASTPDLAYLAARAANAVNIVYNANSFVSKLSLDLLTSSPELLNILHDWGVRQIGELLSLPRSQTIERLGLEAQQWFQKVSTRYKRPLRLIRPIPEYAAAFDFEYEVETIEPLLFLLRRFLCELCERLCATHRVAEATQLTIILENSSTYERTFRIPAPTADVDILFRIIHTHLETLHLPYRITGIRLSIKATLPINDQLHLFESSLRDPNRFGETLAKLKAILGNEQVGIPEKQNTHRPDSFTLHSLFTSPSQSQQPDSIFLGLPLHRYRPSIPVRISITANKPTFIESDTVRGAIRRCIGPYRLSGNWWDKEYWHIEEWDIELTNGCLYRIAYQNNQWQLHGIYDGDAPANYRSLSTCTK